MNSRQIGVRIGLLALLLLSGGTLFGCTAPPYLSFILIALACILMLVRRPDDDHS